MPLLKWDREDFAVLPHADGRRPLDSRDNETVATHWDGTYRDRIGNRSGEFWTYKDEATDIKPVSASRFAKHLESQNPFA